MYYPIQVPFLLNRTFSEAVAYSEVVLSAASDLVICFWEMQPKQVAEKKVTNVIVTDACIDLVVDFDQQVIGFSGMRQTNFDFTFSSAASGMGARMKPGVFHALTGLPAEQAMDNFLPLGATVLGSNFDQDYFFSLSFSEARQYFQHFFVNLASKHQADAFTGFFDLLAQHDFWEATDIYDHFHYSPRQCQRQFMTHFGLSPKMVLCIVRFQKALALLTQASEEKPQLLAETTYYDQSHLIRDFKRHIGLTPKELMGIYQ